MSPLEQRIAEMKAELIRVVAKAEEDMSRMENSFKAIAIENTKLREALGAARSTLETIQTKINDGVMSDDELSASTTVWFMLHGVHRSVTKALAKIDASEE